MFNKRFGGLIKIRKGQTLCNYIQRNGLINEKVHNILFNMTDEEFEKGLSKPSHNADTNISSELIDDNGNVLDRRYKHKKATSKDCYDYGCKDRCNGGLKLMECCEEDCKDRKRNPS